MRSTGSPGPGRPTLTAMAWKTSGVPSTATYEPTAARCLSLRRWALSQSGDLDGDGIADVISDDLHSARYRRRLAKNPDGGRSLGARWTAPLAVTARLPGPVARARAV